MIFPEMDGLEGKLGENINGPSVIKVPDWVENPLGKYYMYFAHHHGKYIRMAFADSPTGPWTIYKPGVLHLENTAAVRHIASPDVIIDEDAKTISMYFHGPIPQEKQQRTFVSTSTNGLEFIASPTVLGPSYFRVFKYKRTFYALAGKTFYRSEDGTTPFEKGALLLPKIRHSAVTRVGNRLVVFYSQRGDAPERILKSEVKLSNGSFKNWKAGPPQEVLKPETTYEGVDLPIKKSTGGSAEGLVHQLRDPAILIDQNESYLYYTIAGESGIAVAKLIE